MVNYTFIFSKLRSTKLFLLKTFGLLCADVPLRNYSLTVP